MAGRRVDAPDAYRVVADLNREWETLRGDSDEVAEWGVRHYAVRGCGDLHEVLAAVASQPDAVLGALLHEASFGSMTAARTVLQAMLGKVVLMAHADPLLGVDAYLVAMWERIRTYPIDRRPVHIAANLALDARKLARRDSARSHLVTPWPPGASFAHVVDRQRLREDLDHGHDLAVLTAGDVIKAALELELIDESIGALLGSVYAEGLTSKDAASRHQTSSSMVRQHCSRAVRQLADHSAEIASYT